MLVAFKRHRPNRAPVRVVRHHKPWGPKRVSTPVVSARRIRKDPHRQHIWIDRPGVGKWLLAALVVGQVDRSKILTGDLQKTTASTTTVTDLYSTDSGRADLVDTQYLTFNIVALIVFFGKLWSDQSQLPDIPDAVMLLTSGAALGYIARKTVQRNPPTISSITPSPGESALMTNRVVMIQGSNFIPSGAGSEDSIRSVLVKFGNLTTRPLPQNSQAKRSTAAQPSLLVDGMTDDTIRVMVPDLSADGKTERLVEVSVVTAPGMETPVFPVRITSPILRVRLEPVVVAHGIMTITLTLLDTTFSNHPVRIQIGETPFDTFWIDNKASVLINRTPTDSKSLSVSCGGATFAAQTDALGQAESRR